MNISFSNILIGLLVVLVSLLAGRHLFSSSELVNGNRAPGFSAELIDGRSFELKDLRGHYVLLDFWGSWCAPCRQINPEWVALYQKYRNVTFEGAEGFRILSVGVERDPDSWRKAIEVDQLDWPYHVLDTASNLESPDSGIAGLYQVEAVPTTFLINPDGVIVGVDLLPREIDQLLERKQ